ncbi:hypothetical protein OG788_45745 [Streptomyces sp. NBC_00647]|uniref:hypothetical protein n=1 Tax=Streptomyces sp. NBC_00647 TaxID=2975796 RepID=UPI0032482EC3
MSAPLRSSSGGPGRQKLLGIYLNDHLAGATAGAGLVHRMVQEHGDSPCGQELRALETDVLQDRRALVRLMRDLHAPARHYKVYGAWLGEKLGRVKPNGRLLRRSGLTLLIELEAMRMGVTGKALLWRSLLAASPGDPRLDSGRLEELLQRAERQLEAVDSLHAKAASAQLTPTGPPSSAREAVAQGTPQRDQD